MRSPLPQHQVFAGRPTAHRIATTMVVASIAFAGFAGTASAGGAGKTTSGCSRKTVCDTTAPTVSITSPASGATVSGSLTISGSASDNVSVSSVSISVDGGAWATASGTTAWSFGLDTASLGNGSHTLTAKALDAAGNASTSTRTVDVENTSAASKTNGSISWSDAKLTTPTGAALAPLGRGRQTEWGSTSVALCSVAYSGEPCAYFRDASTGSTSYVSLPVDTLAGWSNANYAMTGPADLWVTSGDGPIYVRHYQFAGSPLPTSATLVSTQTFGDSDSRHGDLTALASGGVVAVWHQQGATGPQGQYVAYRKPAGGWQVQGPFTFMPTMASKQVVAQQPADNSVWIFSNPDAWGAIGAIHLTEGTAGLSVDWTDASYISTGKYGDFGPDPENPDLALSVDAAAGRLVLAYQDAHRFRFANGTIGSYVAIARIPATGTPSFTSLDTYVERISPLGLVVSAGQVWVAYRPVDPVTYAYTELYANCLCNGAWRTAADLGTVSAASSRTGYGASRSDLTVSMSDGVLHWFELR